MKKLRWIMMVLLALFLLQGAMSMELRAQEGSTNADNKKTMLLTSTDVNSMDQANGQTLLSDLLSTLEQHFDVTFLYKDEVVMNEYVNPIKIGEETGQKLSFILDQLGLAFQQIDEQTYVLLRKKQSSQATPVQEEIGGTVTDAQTGETLPGVNVMIKGTTTGTSTDSGGNFELTVESLQDTLVFSFVGYQTREVPISGRTEIGIQLTPKAIMGEEMVVVGYGTQRKVNLTGSVTSVDQEALEKRSVIQTSMALQGAAPGVTVTQSSGQPGSNQGTIRIRGIGTLGNSDPLVLIDGVEGNINSVNPSEIESINVLKDAASAAIYGSRAANGVILVTTKRGSSGDFQVDYNGFVGMQEATETPEFVGSITYMKMVNELSRNENRDEIFSEEDIRKWQENMDTNPDRYPNTDWENIILNGSAIQQKHSINISGGSETIRSNINLSYLDQGGIIKNTDFTRYSFRANNDINITNKLDINLDLSGRNSIRNQTAAQSEQGANGANGVFEQAYRIPPTRPALLSNGRYGIGWNGYNPLAMVNNGGYDTNNFAYIRSSVSVNYEPIDNLNFSVNFTPEYSYIEDKTFNRTVETYNVGSDEPAFRVPETNSLTDNFAKNLDTYLLGKANWKIDFGDHTFDGLVGFEQVYHQNKWLQGSRDNFPLQDFSEINSGGPSNQQTTGTSSEWALRSFLGRLNYSYKSKYLLEGNLRYDGSSRFKEGSRFGLFPSISAGWRISEEPFMQNIDFISNLKLRTSIGVLGNQQIGTYPYISTIELGQKYPFGTQETPLNGASQTVLANPDISWESTRSIDFGIDVEFFENKLNVTADYYIKETDGILLQLPIPGSMGMSNPYQNAGEVRNEGWDLSLGHSNSINEFNYNISFNLSDVKNKVIDLKETGPYISESSIIKKGYPIDAFYGLEAMGLFQTQKEVDSHAFQTGNTGPGDIKYKDQNGDEIINDNDRKVLGSRIPRYTFGINIAAQFKGFDTSLFIQGVGKKEVYRSGFGAWAFFTGGKVQEWQLDRWTPDNRDASYPRFWQIYSNNSKVSSYWINNASYLRLKNFELGYTLPVEWFGQTTLRNIRIYANGSNLFTIKDTIPGFDPETPSGWGGIYPIVSTYNFGVNINF